MAGFWGGSSNGGTSNLVYMAYKTFNAGVKQLPDITYSPGSATTYSNPNSGYLYGRNITIGVNATIQLTGTGIKTIICDVLTVNGVIDASGVKSSTGLGSGSGIGGYGGGGILVIARQILGTGTLKVNGSNGSTGSAASGTGFDNGGSSPGSFLLDIKTTSGGSAGTADTITTNGYSAQHLLYVPSWLINTLILGNSTMDSSGGNYNGAFGNLTVYGGSGFCGSVSTATTTVTGGAGGSNTIATGGNGSIGGNASAAPSGGGGGGAGGYIWVISETPIPALALQSNGGNGVAGYGTGGGIGGGGAGGAIIQYCPSSSAITSTAGGTGANAGQNGLIQTLLLTA